MADCQDVRMGRTIVLHCPAAHLCLPPLARGEPPRGQDAFSIRVWHPQGCGYTALPSPPRATALHSGFMAHPARSLTDCGRKITKKTEAERTKKRGGEEK